MAKQDVNFTIGADGTAFSRDMGKEQGQVSDVLTRIGSKFLGLQAIAVGVQKAFAGLSAPLRAFGKLENTQAQLAVMMDSKDAAESLTSSLQKLATNGVVSMQDLLAASRPLTHFMEGAEIEQVMELWNDVAWCSRPDNESPVAAMSDCMWNLKYIRDSLRGSASYIRAQNGGKTAYIREDASQSAWDKAEAFLLK